MKTSLISKAAFVFLAILLLAVPIRGWCMNLPLSKELTVKLSALSSQGQMQEVASVPAKTDALGKIAFSFPTVPSSTATPFLHLQISDGSEILRQAIVPAPLPGGSVDVGISETTDLQARAILKAAEISGELSPIHLLVAHALLRNPAISITNAESAGSAIAAGAEATAQSLASDNLTAEQRYTFLNALSRGLCETAAKYRVSVDEAVSFDQKVEAYHRGEAFAVLLQGLLAAGVEAAINLETITAAFAAAGGAAETALEATSSIDPLSIAEMRLSYIFGILTLHNYRSLREQLASLDYAGIALPRFERIFNVIDLVLINTTANQKAWDGQAIEAAARNDIQIVRIQEFNSLATQDLLLFKRALEFTSAGNSSPEYGVLMQETTDRMAGYGGVMAGMTPALLLEILGRQVPASNILQQPPTVPTLAPLELGAWSYIHKIPTFAYTPIPGLVDQLATNQVNIPDFDRLEEPYRSLALLMYDLELVGSLRRQDQQAADDYSAAHPLNPPGWYPLTTVHQILENDRQRRALVRQHISGISPEAKKALISLIIWGSSF